MTVAAAEAAVGLALVIALFRHRESLNPDAFTLAEVVTTPVLALIPLLPVRSASSSTRSLGRGCRRRVSGGLASLAMLASFAVSLRSPSGSWRHAPASARDRADALHLDRVGRLRARPRRSASIRCRR